MSRRVVYSTFNQYNQYNDDKARNTLPNIFSDGAKEVEKSPSRAVELYEMGIKAEKPLSR